MAGGEEGGGFGFEDEGVNLVAYLAADFQHVLKAGGGDQADAGAFAFQRGVGGAVGEAGDAVGGGAPVGTGDFQRGQRLARRVVAGGGEFGYAQAAILAATGDVRECAAAIDAEGVGYVLLSLRGGWWRGWSLASRNGIVALAELVGGRIFIIRTRNSASIFSVWRPGGCFRISPTWKASARAMPCRLGGERSPWSGRGFPPRFYASAAKGECAC